MNSESERRYEYDVALSFAGEDLRIAELLRDGLSEGLEVFEYTSRQAELCGADGLERLREVFTGRCRMAVILLGKSWGFTGWTRVEEDALKERYLKDGADCLFVIVTDPARDKPKWIPETRLRFNLKNFPLEQAIGAIKARAIELGSDFESRTIAKEAELAQGRREFETLRKRMLHSEEGVAAVRREIGRLWACLSTKAAEARSAKPELNVEFEGDSSYSVVRVGGNLGCQFVHRGDILNSVAEDSLTVRIVRGLVLMPRQQPGDYRGQTQKIEERQYRPEFSRSLGWCWADDRARLSSTDDLAHQCVSRLLQMIGN